MQVDPNYLFAKIGNLTVENELLRKQNDEHCLKIADLLAQLQTTNEQTNERNGTPISGQPIEN